MNLKKFLVISIAIHVILLIAIQFIPHDKIKRQKEFITKLISPEELKKPEPPPKPRIMIPKPAIVRPAHRKPSPPPPRPSAPVRHPELPPQQRLVPGEVKDPGRSALEKTEPRFGKPEGDETSRAKTPQSKPLERPGFLDTRKLLDKSVIDQIARKGASEKKTQDRPITFDTSEYKYMGYMNLLRGKLEGSGCWIYPPDAAAQGIYGDLRIRFTIKKSGQLGSVQVVRTSGYKSLDEAALNALRDCGPYWPLPNEWGMEAYTIEGHFIYSLYGAYIR